MCQNGDAEISPEPQQKSQKRLISRNIRRLDPVQEKRVRDLIARSMAPALLPALEKQPQPQSRILVLLQPNRGHAAVAFERQVAMYLGHIGCGLSLTEAGHLYGRDRTTAAHACSVVEARRDDRRFDFLLDLLECCVRLGLRQTDPHLAQRPPRQRAKRH
jgi:Bacterial dnaA protein helix-turn-helix